jgi:undecaprenyl diphosphate synthase
MTEEITIPKHIGYIVDGNRRWAKSHGLPSYEGHLAGYNTIHEVIEATFAVGVEYVTAYIFSTENWKRSEDEVGRLMNLLFQTLTSDIQIFQKNNIKLVVIGSRDGVSDKIVKAIEDAESATASNTGGTLALCFNYGGQLEIVDAIKQIVRSGVKADDVSVDTVNANLYEPDLPPIDLVVRTSGEQRLSNFMLWRAAYSEMMFIEKLWPDMTKDDVTKIIDEFSRRSRRFGG